MALLGTLLLHSSSTGDHAWQSLNKPPFSPPKPEVPPSSLPLDPSLQHLMVVAGGAVLGDQSCHQLFPSCEQELRLAKRRLRDAVVTACLEVNYRDDDQIPLSIVRQII